MPGTAASEIDLLRARHQGAAEETARSGVTPPAFQGDPTFVQLVAAKKLAGDVE